MKNLTIILALTMTMFSCNKEDLTSNINSSKIENIEENIEAQRIYSIYENMDFDNGFFATSNYGKALTPYQTKVNGKVPSDYSITIDKQTIEPDGVGEREGMFLYNNNEYLNYFGKTMSFTLQDSENSSEYEIYVPKPLYVSPIYLYEGEYPTMNIDRTGNTMEWDADNNSSGILLKYETFDADAFGGNANLIDINYKIISDNANYNIDNLISNTNVKSVKLSFIRANAVNFVTKNNKNVMFSFQAIDFHYYAIN